MKTLVDSVTFLKNAWSNKEFLTQALDNRELVQGNIDRQNAAQKSGENLARAFENYGTKAIDDMDEIRTEIVEKHLKNNKDKYITNDP